MKKLISVIVPCFNEEEALPHFYREICRVSGEMEQVVLKKDSFADYPDLKEIVIRTEVE